MIYFYWIHRGLASLHKNLNGNDVDAKRPIKIGRFASDTEAKEACEKHHAKACQMARAAGREVPRIMFR